MGLGGRAEGRRGRQRQPWPGRDQFSPWSSPFGWVRGFPRGRTLVLAAKIQLALGGRSGRQPLGARPRGALPRHSCPCYQRAQQRGSASRLSGAAPSGKGTDWRVRIVSPPRSWACNFRQEWSEGVFPPYLKDRVVSFYGAKWERQNNQPEREGSNGSQSVVVCMNVTTFVFLLLLLLAGLQG